MKGTSTITRSAGRTLQFSFSRPRRVGTYVKPPHLRRSVIGVKQAMRGLAALAALQFATPPAFALPTGEVTQFGDPNVARNGQVMDITHTTQKAGLNWTSFSIAAPETVNVHQPNASAVLLNRVVGADQSQIFGALNANGKVFLVNPNGIVFAPGASVNVGGLVASTLDITNENFENGIFTFTKGATAGSVVNQGNITVTVPDSYAALIGPQVSNEGIISVAARGTVALAAGNGVTLDIIGDSLINVVVDAAAAGAAVLNASGAQILAEGGRVLLTARSADALLGTVINNDGLIRATSLVEANGRIFLDGGTGGVANSGALEVVGLAGNVNSSGGAFDSTGTISGPEVAINHTGTVTIAGSISAGNMSVTGGGVEITNSGAAGLAVNASGTQTFTATQNSINVTNSGTGLLAVNAGTLTTDGVQTFAASQGDINITSPGTGGIRVESFGTSGVGGTQTFDTQTGAGLATTGNMTVVGSGGDVRVSTNAGIQTIKLTGTLTVGDAAAQRSTQLSFNRLQDVRAAAISVIGGAGNTAGAVLHSFGGQTIVTGNINITGGTAPAFTVIPGFISSPSAAILNNTIGIQDITADAITITGGASGNGNSAGIGNFANSAQKITADSITLTGGAAATNSNAFIQSGNNTFVGTTEVQTGALTLTGQRSGAAIGGGPGSSQDITVTGDTTLTASGLGGSAVIGLLGTTTNATYTTKFTGTGNLSLQGGIAVADAPSAHIGAGSNHTNPTGNIDVQAANITLTAGNGSGGAFIGNSGSQPTLGGGNISVTATTGDLVMRSSADGSRSAIRSVGGSIGLKAARDIDAAGGRLDTGGNLTTDSGRHTTFGQTTVGGNLLATAVGAITNAQTLTVTGLASLSGGSITLGGPLALTFNAGTLTFNSTGDVSIVEGSDTLLAGTNTAGSLSLLSAGTITDGLNTSLTVTNGASLSGASISLANDAGDVLSVGGNALLSAGAGGITIGAPGTVNFGTLTASSLGAVSITEDSDTDLTGASAVGSVSLTSAGLLTVNGDVTTTNAPISLIANSLTNNATISNGGGANTANVLLRADAFDLDGTAGTGQVQGGASAVVLTPRNNANSLGILSAGDTTIAQSDIDAIHTTNFVVFGSANQGFTGNTTIGETALVNGNGKSLAFFRANTAPITATTTIGAQGVSTIGDVIVNAGSGSIISNPGTGTVTGNHVQLVAARGIGTSGARINTSADTLAANNGGVAGGIFISEASDVSLAAFTLNVGGNINNQANLGGAGGYDLTAAGTITVGAGGVNSGVSNGVPSTGATTLTTTGLGHNIVLNGGNVGNLASATTLTSAGSVTGTVGVVQGTDVTLDSATGIGTGPAGRVNTAATTLAARSTTSGGVFVQEADAVTLATIGAVENSAAAGSAYDVTAAGTLSVGLGGVNVSGTGTTTLTTTGVGSNISLGDVIGPGNIGVGNSSAATTLVSAGNITGLANTVRGTAVTLDSDTGVGTGTGAGQTRVSTAANTLAARTRTSGGVFVTEGDNVSLSTIGTVANGAAAGGSYDVIAATGAITVDGNVTTANGTIRLEALSLTNNATISNGGGANTANITLRADAFDLDGAGAGQVQGGNAAVIVTPHTNTNSLGIVSAGDTTVAQSDLDAIHTTNFVVLGSANQGFTGNTTIGQNALVNGNGKSLAFFHALGPSTTTIGLQGVTTTGDIAITSGSIVSNGGTITGNRVQLVANTGIGTSLARINTSANTLAAHNNGAAGSGVFVSEQNDVTLAAFTLNVGGIANSQANLGGTGTYDLTAAGTITVGNGGVNSGVSNGVPSTGATTLTTTGAGHNIDIGANNVGNLASTTTLTSAGNITGTTGVVNGTAVTLSAAGDIGGGEPNPLHVDAGTLNFNSPGAVTISEGNDTVLTGTNTAGSLTLLSAGSITDAPATSVNVAGDAIFFGPSITLADNGGDALTVGGQALFNSGPISVGLGGTANFGTLRFTSTGGDVSIHESSDTVLADASNADSLVLSSAGSITNDNFASLRVAGNANLSGTSINLGNAPVDLVHLNSLTFNSPGAVDIRADSAIVLSGASTAGSLNLTAEGNLTNAPATSVTVATTANFTGTQITLADHAADVLSVGTDASFLATTSSLSIGAAGTANFGTLNFNSFLAASIHESSDTVLTGANTAPSLVLSSTGSLTDAPNTSLIVAGNASLSGASITLGDNAGDTTNFGTLTFNSAGAVSIAESSSMDIVGVNTAGSATLTSTAGISDAGAASVNVTGLTDLSGTLISLGGGTFNSGTLRFNSPGAVTIAEDSAMNIVGSNTAASATLSANGALSDAGATGVAVTGLASVTGSSITLGTGAFNAGALKFNSTGAVSISEGSDTVLTGSSTAGTLALSSTGTITDAPATSMNVTAGNASFTGTSITLADSAGDVFEVNGNASFKATTGGITVGDAGFVSLGSLTFNSPGAVVVQEDCCTLIAGINTAGSLNLTSTQGISNTANAKVTVTGNASLTGTSIILADNAGNVLDVGGSASFTATTGGVTIGAPGTANFGQLTFNAPGAVSITEDSATVLTGTNTAGSLALSSAGSITESGTSLVVTNDASLTGTSINLVDGAGDVLSVGGNASFTATGGGAITIGEAGTVNFGSLTFDTTGPVSITEDSSTHLHASTAGSLTLASAGPVTQDGPLTVNGTGNIDAGGNAITLTSTGNDFTGTLTLKGTVTSVDDKNGLSVTLDTGDTIIIANATLTSTGDLILGGKTSGNLTAISNGGVLQWTNLTVGSEASPKAALLIAALPSRAITGIGSQSNAFDLGVTFSKRANATGGTLEAKGGEVVLIAANLPRSPDSNDEPSITAKTAILSIEGLIPGGRVTIKVNGQLRLLASEGVFRFKAGSELPEGITTLDPKKVQVFIGNSSITSTADELAARSAITAAQQSAVSNASADARQSFGTDSVTQQIDMGFAGDVGIAPTMGHSVPLQGEIISTPEGVSESKGGQ